MHISLIGTVHSENGLANVRSLASILDYLQPAVIYAEIPPEMLPKFLDGSHGNLESAAIAQYQKSNPVVVVPVDLETPGDDFFREAEEMFNKIERTSPIYRRLLDQNFSATRDHGFLYLNSECCCQAWTAIYKEIYETIEWIHDDRLEKIYAQWQKINDFREKAMLENVTKHAAENAQLRGLLLVGAAHRNSLIEKVK